MPPEPGGWASFTRMVRPCNQQQTVVQRRGEHCGRIHATLQAADMQGKEMRMWHQQLTLKSVSFSCWMAAWAAAESFMVTKAKPRERPLSRSWGMNASCDDGVEVAAGRDNAAACQQAVMLEEH